VCSLLKLIKAPPGLKLVFFAGLNGTAEEAAEKVGFATVAPKGAVENE
jgi:hypothetical protein